MNAPTKGEIIKDFGRGVVLRAPMPDNYPWVLAHLREGDAKEDTDANVEQEKCPMGVQHAALWLNDELAGFWDSLIYTGRTAEDEIRSWAFLTTEAVERNKIKFARMTRPVFEYLWKLEHPWVTKAVVCTWDGYARCINWQMKYFSAEPFHRATMSNEWYTFYILERPTVKE